MAADKKARRRKFTAEELSRGGKNRAKKLSAKRRSAIARAGALATNAKRWGTKLTEPKTLEATL